MISLDRITGKTVWDRSLVPPRREYKNPSNDGASPSAVTDGTNVYAFFGDYGLISCDGRGNERWRTPLGPFSSLWGMGTSPILAGDTVILVMDGFSGSLIAGFDRDSGRKKWEAERPAFALNYSTPVLRPLAEGGSEVLVLGAVDLSSYDTSSGERRWSVADQRGSVVASPVLVDDRTVVSMETAMEETPPFPDKDGDGVVGATDIPTEAKEWQTARTLNMVAKELGNRDGRISPAEWKAFWSGYQGKPSVAATNIGTPAERSPARGTRWSYTKGIARVATPLAYGGVEYYVNMGGIVTALDLETGGATKTGRLAGALDGYYASPVAAEGRLYFTSDTGKIVVVRAGGDWTVLATNDLDDPCYATPALSDGKIFVRTALSLYCFGTSDEGH
ncbi:MAG TPA: PQQ-binding-like beta-propeller repeat protein [Bryobacteraceae bacterium]|nr:PQQ-binding-like beta-propeller repeat protein [Bryobacteraceae bacterium]